MAGRAAGFRHEVAEDEPRLSVSVALSEDSLQRGPIAEAIASRVAGQPFLKCAPGDLKVTGDFFFPLRERFPIAPGRGVVCFP